MTIKPKILATESLAETKIFHVEAVDLLFSNGEKRRFERLQHRNRGAVMVVALLDTETVLLIREYAVGLEEYQLALPKGLLEPGEDILEAANRELQEETGFAARQLSYFKRFHTAPGYIMSYMEVVLAQDLYASRLPGDEPEPIEVVPWKLYHLDRLLERPDFTDARNIATLLLLKEHLASGSSAI